MRNKSMNVFIVLGYLVIFSVVMNSFDLARAQEGPVIHIDPITYTFPNVFEGESLSHDFVVSNRGTADLEIKDVTHQ